PAGDVPSRRRSRAAPSRLLAPARAHRLARTPHVLQAGAHARAEPRRAAAPSPARVLVRLGGPRGPPGGAGVRRAAVAPPRPERRRAASGGGLPPPPPAAGIRRSGARSPGAPHAVPPRHRVRDRQRRRDLGPREGAAALVRPAPSPGLALRRRG